MPDPEVIIIGGGVAGLTCGCLLAKNGLKVLLIEKNQKVGGCWTSPGGGISGVVASGELTAEVVLNRKEMD